MSAAVELRREPEHGYLGGVCAGFASRLGIDPLLIRIDTKSGHGASSLTKALETTADIYAFIMFNMGVTPAQLGTR